MSESSKSAMLSSLFKGNMKTYTTYDANGRPEYVYQAPADAAHGSPCLLTRYGYNAEGKPLRSKEYLSTWDSTYDFS